ncbi:hypothetical protein JHK84_043427 [Glycine max]|nr:hypothetical protein JHK84_043427 [Glycine max]
MGATFLLTGIILYRSVLALLSKHADSEFFIVLRRSQIEDVGPKDMSILDYWRQYIFSGFSNTRGNTFLCWFRQGKFFRETPFPQKDLSFTSKRPLSANCVASLGTEVPKRLWINPDVVAALEIEKVCIGLKPWLAVALFLRRQRSRSNSLWKHYFSILPKETDSTIYWWVSFALLVRIRLSKSISRRSK